jgi:hypothetical protein
MYEVLTAFIIRAMSVSWKLTDVSEVLTASIIRALMMEAVSTSEMSVNFYETTWHNIPEDGRLLTASVFKVKTEVYGPVQYRTIGHALFPPVCETVSIDQDHWVVTWP